MPMKPSLIANTTEGRLLPGTICGHLRLLSMVWGRLCAPTPYSPHKIQHLKGNMMPAASLSVESLTVTYGKLCALDCVDLGAGPGATALLGPNGAGKSTLIRCLATVQTPDSGVIRFNGLGLTSRSELREYRRHLGYMPQSPGAYPSWTLMGFLSYIAELKEIPRPRIRSECEADQVLVLCFAERTADAFCDPAGGSGAPVEAFTHGFGFAGSLG